jgi:hypothetical protein
MNPAVESDSERILRGRPRGKRANIKYLFSTDRRFPAACGGELQFGRVFFSGGLAKRDRIVPRLPVDGRSREPRVRSGKYFRTDQSLPLASDTDIQSARQSLILVRKSLSRLSDYVERESYRGYDPYDALLSPAASHPLFRTPYPRIAFTQILRRLPFNLRPVLGIPMCLNPKGLALFLSGTAARQAAGFPVDQSERIRRLVRLLEDNRSRGFHGICWGYPFPWQNRNQLYPAFTPTLVNTGFAGHALLDAYAVTGDRKPRDMAASAVRFILEDLCRVVNDKTRLCLGYTPLDGSRIYNSNAIGASFLARIGSLLDREDWVRTARRMMSWVSEHQNSDGSWAYGDSPSQGWIDLHHTAFILESLSRYEAAIADRRFRTANEKGTAYFLRTFFRDDGSASLWHDRSFPKDIHAFAAVAALCAVPQDDAVRHKRRSLVRWLVTHMQDPSGFFYYQRHRHYCIRIPYMRWSQAWAFHGLAASLSADSGNGEGH